MISQHAQLEAFLRADAERRLVKGINCPICSWATAVILLDIVLVPVIAVVIGIAVAR